MYNKEEQLKKQKQLGKLKNNPTNVSFEEISNILERNGFTKRSPHGGSSHFTFEKGDMRITIPFSKPIKEYYVRRVLQLIEKSKQEGAINESK